MKVVPAPKDLIARGSLPSTSRCLKSALRVVAMLTRHQLLLVLFRFETLSLTSSTLSWGDVVTAAEPATSSSTSLVAVVLPRPLCDRTSRAKWGRSYRYVVNRLPRSALGYVSCYIVGRCVSVNHFSCSCLFSFSWTTLQNRC